LRRPGGAGALGRVQRDAPDHRGHGRPGRATTAGSSSCMPSMGAALEVRVLRELGHRNPREPQGRDREGASGGSGERTDGPTNRNRMRGEITQGKRACDREALVTEGGSRKSGGRVGKASVLIWGGLASHPKG